MHPNDLTIAGRSFGTEAIIRAKASGEAKHERAPPPVLPCKIARPAFQRFIYDDASRRLGVVTACFLATLALPRIERQPGFIVSVASIDRAKAFARDARSFPSPHAGRP